MHRLTRSTISVPNHSQSIDYAYDAAGNFLKKTDYSQNSTSAYRYVAGTNRLSAVTLKSGAVKTFGYDGKGNQTHANNRKEVTYNVFNKPTNINRLGTNTYLYYDANWARHKQISTTNNVSTVTYYVGNYEVIKKGTTTTTLSYIGDTAIYKEVNGSASIRFTHKDRLGSTTTFTHNNGWATGYRSYDPFGKPKMGNGRTMGSYGLSDKLANNINDPQNITKRGFTGHEHLDELEIIHMNGRVYDYNVGRFMSVDPFIQGVGNSQGINPYSYVMNNPLGYTDPSGYQSQMTTECSNNSASAFSSCLFFSEVGITFGGDVTGSGTDYVYNGVSAERGPLKTNVSVTDIKNEESTKDNQGILEGQTLISEACDFSCASSERASMWINEGKTQATLEEILFDDQELIEKVREAIDTANAYSQVMTKYDKVGVTILRTQDGYEIGDPNATVNDGTDQILRGGINSDVRPVNPKDHVLVVVVERNATRRSFLINSSSRNNIASHTKVPYIFVGKKFGKSYFYAPPMDDLSSPLTEIKND